jgi:ligand-binding sensor domain-containing protein
LTWRLLLAKLKADLVTNRTMLQCYRAGILFLCFIVSSITLHCQPTALLQKDIIFDQLPDKLGLEQSTINCIIQDRDGILWIGTWSGLIRYDGYNTINYRSDNAPGKIKSNKITALYEDHDGAIWIGTLVGGLFRYDKANDEFIRFIHKADDAKSISNNSIWAIQRDRNGTLWVGTENGLNRYNELNKSFLSYYYENSSNSLSHSFITDLFLSSRGDLWIGTENGLNKLIVDDSRHCLFEHYIYNDAKANVNVDPGNHYLHNYIFRIDELVSNDSSSIWFSTIKGLKQVTKGKVVNYELANKPSSFNYFRSLKIVNGDYPVILVGSEMGLNFFDPQKKQFTRFLGNFDKAVNLSHNTVTSIFIDRGGVLWVGTKKGLNKYDSYSKDFKLYLTSTFDKTNSIITGICESDDKGYWITTIGGGLYKFIDGTFIHFNINEKSENNFNDFIQTLYKDSKGNLWLGTAGAGAFVFNEHELNHKNHIINKFIHYDKSNGSIDSHIMSLTEDNTGNLGVGIWSMGLSKIMPSGKVVRYTNSILKQAPIVALYADRSGVLWVGTRGNGMYKISEKNEKLTITQFSHR